MHHFPELFADDDGGANEQQLWRPGLMNSVLLVRVLKVEDVGRVGVAV